MATLEYAVDYTSGTSDTTSGTYWMSGDGGTTWRQVNIHWAASSNTTWELTTPPQEQAIPDLWPADIGIHPTQSLTVDMKIEKERLQYRQWSRNAAERRALRLLEMLFGSVEGIPGFSVNSQIHKGRTYYIPTNGDMVRVFENGEYSHKLCAHPKGELPKTDHVIARKLMLEINEEAFLAVANRH